MLPNSKCNCLIWQEILIRANIKVLNRFWAQNKINFKKRPLLHSFQVTYLNRDSIRNSDTFFPLILILLNKISPSSIGIIMHFLSKLISNNLNKTWTEFRMNYFDFSNCIISQDQPDLCDNFGIESPLSQCIPYLTWE